MSNFLASCNLGQWFMIAGYQIMKMAKWKSVWRELYNQQWYNSWWWMLSAET